MNKPTIFNPEDYAFILQRLETLESGAARQWGKMSPAQMLAHVNVPLETGLGKIQPAREGNFITRPLARWYVLTRTRFPANLPTLKAFVIKGERDFEEEKRRLLANLNDAFSRSLHGAWHPHHAFGALTAAQWGELTYLHLDHHFRQFAV